MTAIKLHVQWCIHYTSFQEFLHVECHRHKKIPNHLLTYLGYAPPIQKVSSKSVHNFLSNVWLNGLVVSTLEMRTWRPRFESRVAPLFHWVETLGKLFTHIASPVSQLQETGVQKGGFRRLSGYYCMRVNQSVDRAHRALQACIMDSPGDWRRRAGCPRQSWLRTVEADLRPMNLGLATAKRRAQDRSAWRLLVATATSSTSSWRRSGYGD